METIKIDLKRKKLSDNFKACDQKIPCQCAFNDYMLKAIEAKVDELCMSLECFSVSAIVNLQPKVHICGSRVTLRVFVVLEKILNYDLQNLLDKPIALKDF